MFSFIVAGVLLLVLPTPLHTLAPYENPYGTWEELSHPAYSITGRIFGAIDRGDINISNFEKLDFVNGDPEHGWNPGFWSSLHRQKYGENEFFLTHGSTESTDLKNAINAITTEENQAVHINIRRHLIGESYNDTLTLIIPNIKPAVCLKHGKIDILDLQIAEDNHSVITDTNFLPKCFKNREGKVFLSVPLAGRIFKLGKWYLNRPRAF